MALIVGAILGVTVYALRWGLPGSIRSHPVQPAVSDVPAQRPELPAAPDPASATSKGGDGTTAAGAAPAAGPPPPLPDRQPADLDRRGDPEPAVTGPTPPRQAQDAKPGPGPTRPPRAGEAAPNDRPTRERAGDAAPERDGQADDPGAIIDWLLKQPAKR
jgi:hypothetical protein